MLKDHTLTGQSFKTFVVTHTQHIKISLWVIYGVYFLNFRFNSPDSEDLTFFRMKEIKLDSSIYRILSLESFYFLSQIGVLLY